MSERMSLAVNVAAALSSIWCCQYRIDGMVHKAHQFIVQRYSLFVSECVCKQVQNNKKTTNDNGTHTLVSEGGERGREIERERSENIRHSQRWDGNRLNRIKWNEYAFSISNVTRFCKHVRCGVYQMNTAQITIRNNNSKKKKQNQKTAKNRLCRFAFVISFEKHNQAMISNLLFKT